MSRVALSLGSNLDQPEVQLAQAVERLADIFSDIQTSVFYQTEPVGGPAQPDYINAAVIGETDQSPQDFIQSLQKIEETFGRKRNGDRNQPRTLDIDLIFYDDLILDSDNLTIPHPRFRTRRFVLEPLVELIPNFSDPISGKRLVELLRECPDRHRVTRMEQHTTV